MDKKNTRRVMLGIKVSRETRSKLRELAARDHRTMSGYIRVILESHVAEASRSRTAA